MTVKSGKYAVVGLQQRGNSKLSQYDGVLINSIRIMEAINEQLNVKTRSTSVVENVINNDPSLVQTKKAILRLEY